MRGASPSLAENTPYGRFWIGKWESASTGMKERSLGSLGWGMAFLVRRSGAFFTLPGGGRVGSYGAQQNMRRGGVISPLGHRSRGETVTPPRRALHARRPSPSRGG